MTAAEADAIMRSDPEWVRRRAEKDAEHKARVEQIQREIEPEHAPLLAELAAAGVRVRMNPKVQLTLAPEARPGETPIAVHSIDDLVNTGDSYPEAIPILVKHLRMVHHPIMVNCIARALTVKDARGTGAARLILDRLKATEPNAAQAGDDYQARWALANALTVVADTTMRGELESLASDVQYQDVKDRLDVAVRNLGGK